MPTQDVAEQILQSIVDPSEWMDNCFNAICTEVSQQLSQLKVNIGKVQQ